MGSAASFSIANEFSEIGRLPQHPWCLRESAWLLPPADPAPAHPWDRQPGSPAHRSRAHVVSAMGCRRPLAHRPSAARRIRPGPQPPSPTSPPCTHLTLAYSPTLVKRRVLRSPYPAACIAPLQHL